MAKIIATCECPEPIYRPGENSPQYFLSASCPIHGWPGEPSRVQKYAKAMGTPLPQPTGKHIRRIEAVIALADAEQAELRAEVEKWQAIASITHDGPDDYSGTPGWRLWVRATTAEAEIERLTMKPDDIEEMLGIDPNDPVHKVAKVAVEWKARALKAEAEQAELRTLVEDWKEAHPAVTLEDDGAVTVNLTRIEERDNERIAQYRRRTHEAEHALDGFRALAAELKHRPQTQGMAHYSEIEALLDKSERPKAKREPLADRLLAEFETLLDVEETDGGYDCCGCSAPSVLLHNVIARLAALEQEGQ